MKKLSAEDFAHIDIPSTVERYTSTRLDVKRTQCEGACPYDDCPGDDNGFIVYDVLSNRGSHFYCRTCGRHGDIVKLLQDILHKRFPEVCELLDIGKGKSPLTANMLREDHLRKRKEEAQKQLAILATIARTSQRGLQYERAQAYLAQRGVSLEIAMQYGLCYIPPYKTMSEELKAAWWGMRQWTDRLIFPLSDGGYTGRSLFLWVPGMDENEHKKVLDCFNNRVKAHNKQVKAQGGKEKEQIPRWYTTYTEGYFHGRALAENEHVTVVEGPFDALACLAAGINDVVAAGRNGIDSNHIPVTVCYATIAFDADDKGQGGAADSEKTFRRKGIKTDQRTSPDDGLGGDWSERYRRAGIDGLAPLLNRCEQEEGSYDRCADCGASMADEEREFFYNEVGVCYCEKCRSWELLPPTTTTTPTTPVPEISHQVLSQDEIMARFKKGLPPDWTIHMDRVGYTLAEHVRLQQEKVQSGEDFWERCHEWAMKPCTVEDWTDYGFALDKKTGRWYHVRSREKRKLEAIHNKYWNEVHEK
jgi:hypothetical protein